ncbi:hypothetical protein [Bdellovibrio sp. HCB209]|uniref:hypothetical protein n=1 Tax=Bdellovibrio sp. HCB209 TaxID=3394354 RepID=UPI0039B460ED
MVRGTFVLLSFLLLSACSGGGGGGSSPGGSTSTKATLSYANSSVTSNKAYMKDGETVTVTVQPKGSDGAVYDISGEWTITVYSLCYGCSGTQTPNFQHGDFSKVNGAYQASFTAPASAKVDLLLRFDRIDNSAALDNGNVPKHTLSAYSVCDDAIPNGQILRTATISGTSYNVLCDMKDIERMSMARDNDGTWYVPQLVSNSYYTMRAISGSELTAYMSLSGQNFYVMNDIIAPSNYSFDQALPIGGLIDMAARSGVSMMSSTYMNSFSGIIEGNSKEVDALLVGYINGGTVRNIKIKDMRLSGNSRIYSGTSGATLQNVTFLTPGRTSGSTGVYSTNCGTVSISGGNAACTNY